MERFERVVKRSVSRQVRRIRVCMLNESQGRGKAAARHHHPQLLAVRRRPGGVAEKGQSWQKQSAGWGVGEK